MPKEFNPDAIDLNVRYGSVRKESLDPEMFPFDWFEFESPPTAAPTYDKHRLKLKDFAVLQATLEGPAFIGLDCAEDVNALDVVALDAAGDVIKANKSSANTANVIGFAATTTSSGDKVRAVTGGVLDGFSGLTPNDVLYLDASGGYTQDFGDLSAGDYVVALGVAVSESEVRISITQPLLYEKYDGPTYAELQDGYNESGGTTTPTTPTIAICKAVGTKAILIIWDRQLNLTNFDHYEVQVSDDDSTWYSLEFDGSDWKDQLGADTDHEVEFLVHGGIPHTGDVDDPSGRTLYYRVRRVTKAAAVSNWSSSANATAKTVAAGDIAANSIYANNLLVGVLEALFANVSDRLTVGAGGLIGQSYGDTAGYQECGLSGADKTLTCGLTTATTYYYKVTVDGEDQTEYSITTGETAPTFGELLSLLNANHQNCTWSVVNSDLRCTSITKGPSSSIALAAGTTGTDLFDSLTDFSSFDSAIEGTSTTLSIGEQRMIIDENECRLDEWSGSEWVTILRFGGDDDLKWYLQARGLIKTGADINTLSIGEVAPDGSAIYDFEEDLKDQNGVDPWSTWGPLDYTATARFGPKAITSTSGAAYLEDSEAYGIDWESDFSISAWLRVSDGPGAAQSVLSLKHQDPTKVDVDTSASVPSGVDGPEGGAFVPYDSTHVAYVGLDSTNSYITVWLGTISGSSISWDSGTSNPTLGSISGIGESVLIDTNKILIQYRDGAAAWYGYAIVATISDSTVSFGAASTAWAGDGTNANSPTELRSQKLNTNKAVFAWKLNGQWTGYTRIINVSGTTISFGPVANFQAYSGSSTVGIISMVVLSTTKFSIDYRYWDGSTSKGKTKICSIDGSDNITFSSWTEWYTVTGDAFSLHSFLLTTDTYIIAWVRDDTREGRALVTTVSGTTATHHTFTQFSADEAGLYLCGCYLTASTFFLTYQGYPGGSFDYHRTVIGVVDNTTITFGATYNGASLTSFPTNLDVGRMGEKTIVAGYRNYTSGGLDTFVHRIPYQEIDVQLVKEASVLKLVFEATVEHGADVSETIELTGIGWHHVAVTFNSSTKVLSFVVDNGYVDKALSAYTLGVGRTSLRLDILEELYRNIFDNLLVVDGDSLSTSELIAHTALNQPWVGADGIDVSKDLVLLPKNGGVIKAMGDTTVDGDLEVTGSLIGVGWQKIADPPTGWLASKTSGWTADQFTPGGLEVDFSSVVPAGTKAVRVEVYNLANKGTVYYRKRNDANISNTPQTSDEWSHGIIYTDTTLVVAQAVIWLDANYRAQFAVTNSNQDVYIAYPMEYLL